MRVLITGGAGFIGSHLVEHFHDGAEVRVLDNFRSGSRDNLAGLRCELVEGSVLDRECVAQAVRGVEYVFHLAAMVSVPESMTKAVECNQINAAGTLILLEEAAKAGARKLVFSSSAAVYGDNPATPKVETMLPEPKSPYAITKLDGEHYCQMFASEGWLATTSLRYFNVFGPRQNPRSAYAAAVPIFIERALRHQPITIHGDGEQTRDFIEVGDIVAANAYFATKPDSAGVFNVAHGRRITINDLSRTICELTGSKSQILHGPGRAGDVKHSMASIAKLRDAGFEPGGNLRTGLERTIQFYRGRLNG